LDEFVYEALNENLTLIAVDGKSGKLLGCCVNVVAHKTNYEEISADDYLKKYQVCFSNFLSLRMALAQIMTFRAQPSAISCMCCTM